MSPTHSHPVRTSPGETDPRFPQAVQYVLGELSSAEQERFEAALAEDVTLCILVAEASQFLAGVRMALTELVPATVVAPPVVAPVASPRRDRWTVAVLVAAATGMAATLLATFTGPSTGTQTVRSFQAIQLVALWRDAGRGENGTSPNELPFDSDASAPLHDDRIPPWMMAAVSMEERRSRSPLQEQPEHWEDN